MIRRRTVKQPYPRSADNSAGPHSCRAEYWFYRLRGHVTFKINEATVTGTQLSHYRYSFVDGSALLHVFNSKTMYWYDANHNTQAMRQHP